MCGRAASILVVITWGCGAPAAVFVLVARSGALVVVVVAQLQVVHQLLRLHLCLLAVGIQCCRRLSVRLRVAEQVDVAAELRVPLQIIEELLHLRLVARLQRL